MSAVLPFAEVAATMDVPVTRVHQYIREGHLLVARDEQGRRGVLAASMQDGAPVKALAQVVTLLRDNRFDEDEILLWLHRPDDSLPGTPIDALRANRGTEVKRRAQAAGF